MLEIGKANEVKFKVGVNGTQAPPTVRLVIGVNEHELGFKAEKLLGGGDDDWFSEVKIPEGMAAGEYDFRVEVIVNNRLFTPIKRKVTVGTLEPILASVTEMNEPAHPTQKPKQTETWEGEGGALPAAPEKPQPLPSKPLDPLKPTPPKVVKTIASLPGTPIKGLMREAASQDDTVAHRPEKKAVVMQAPIKNTPTRVYKSPAPKPKAEPIKITMAEIAAESAKRFDKVLKESASYREPCAPVKPVNVKHQVPITLTKGDITYE